MLYPWHRLPESVRAALLQASCGRLHLLNTAASVLDAAQHLPMESSLAPTAPADIPQTNETELTRRTLIELGSGLLLSAFEEHPFDSLSAQRLRDLDRAIPFLDGRQRILLNRVLTATHPPTGPVRTKLERLTQQGDADGLCAIAREECLENPGNLFWVGFAQYHGLREGRYDWVQSILFDCQGAMPAPLYSALLAGNAFIHGDYAKAESLYRQAAQNLPCDLWRERQAEALLRLGDEEQALGIWDDILLRRPWHVSLWQRRHSCRNGLHRPGNIPENGVVLLYTWNGGRKIDLTLKALADSQLPDFTGAAQILMLDNGSTDGITPEILAGWAEKLGPRLRLITLPCNIGAPAARNWLLTEPESRAAYWVAFLDDDLLVPPDWLRHFDTAMRAAPDHAVYGCQILRHHSPRLIQAVDMHQLPPAVSSGPGWLPESPVHLQASYHGEGQPDFGQFAYTRSCLHVSGCCHLFSREALDEAGGFDLRFAPTQVDDFEHDVRLASRGTLACYHGHLRVHHMQTTGQATVNSLAKAMNSHANHLKLQALYPQQEAEALRVRCLSALLQDTIRKQH